MLGAIVFAVVAWLASLWIKKPLALAVGGGIAGCVWTAPHVPAAMGLPGWQPIAIGAVVTIGALCLVTLLTLIHKLRAGREADYDPFGPDDTEIPADFEGLGRHFYRDIPGPARVPGVLSSGVRQACSLAASDVAFAASGIAAIRARRQGRPGRLARAAPLGNDDRERAGRS